MSKISLIREIKEIKTQLAYQKNLGFFFGAGTSCALKIPNIAQLTQQVEALLEGEILTNFQLIKKDLENTIPPSKPNIEDILNQVRRIRKITGETNKKYQEVSGESAKEVDKIICSKIYEILSIKEAEADFSVPKKFFAWLSILNKDFAKEIFTCNYDLIIEKSLEASQIPYFDGFVGSYEPFFWQESVETIVHTDDLTQNWIRLWKIHGSLSWFWKKQDATTADKVVRIGKVGDITQIEDEVVIYPSRDKYDSSRKQPFIAYFDRLKHYLLNGELLFIFTGYSFSDQHINEIVFNCLRQNKRLSVLVFFFNDDEVMRLHSQAASYMNLSVFGPTRVILNGELGEWALTPDEETSLKDEDFWNNAEKKFTLGDFNHLVEFLIASSGKKAAIESMIK